jgi:hypothetical protein
MNSIKTLPVDTHPPTPTELELLDTLFGPLSPSFPGLGEFASTLLAVALFLLLSMPQADATIRRMFSAAASPAILMAIKATIFAVFFYAASNLSFAKTNSLKSMPP